MAMMIKQAMSMYVSKTWEIGWKCRSYHLKAAKHCVFNIDQSRLVSVSLHEVSIGSADLVNRIDVSLHRDIRYLKLQIQWIKVYFRKKGEIPLQGRTDV